MSFRQEVLDHVQTEYGTTSEHVCPPVLIKARSAAEAETGLNYSMKGINDQSVLIHP